MAARVMEAGQVEFFSCFSYSIYQSIKAILSSSINPVCI